MQVLAAGDLLHTIHSVRVAVIVPVLGTACSDPLLHELAVIRIHLRRHGPVLRFGGIHVTVIVEGRLPLVTSKLIISAVLMRSGN